MSSAGSVSKMTFVVSENVAQKGPSWPGGTGACGSTSATPVCTWWLDPLRLCGVAWGAVRCRAVCVLVVVSVVWCVLFKHNKAAVRCLQHNKREVTCPAAVRC
jgi:hypothetical protein